MVRLFVLLFVFIATFVAYRAFNSISTQSALDEATLFMNKVRIGNIVSVINEFGDNTCNCQPHGGFQAYLKYRSGEEANLAFLLGYPFEIGKCTAIQLPPPANSGPGFEQPEDWTVFVPVQFSPKTSPPYFLPLDMAYGHDMPQQEWLEFINNPEQDWSKAFALRVRPSLEANFITKEAHENNIRYKADLAQELLPDSQLKYIEPKDAGAVLKPDGSKASAIDLAQDFPRLIDCTMRLYVVRRGKNRHWSVKKAEVVAARISSADGKIHELAPEQLTELRIYDTKTGERIIPGANQEATTPPADNAKK